VSALDDLRGVVRLLVDQPEKVEIQERVHGERDTLELRVAEADLGKVIGRQGRTARALRRFLAARGEKGGGEWELRILD
jgi:predicted RNA-binding protein YlqC (UPF0109 family)